MLVKETRQSVSTSFMMTDTRQFVVYDLFNVSMNFSSRIESRSQESLGECLNSK